MATNPQKRPNPEGLGYKAKARLRGLNNAILRPCVLLFELKRMMGSVGGTGRGLK